MNLVFLSNVLLLTAAVKAIPLSKRSSLEWSPCELEGIDSNALELPFDCASLIVPLDYTNPDGSDDLTLQLIKINATKEPVLGSVVFNPGGPGASGVEDLAEAGPIYSEVLGGQYDLISFDPRGTGRTIPFTCAINWTEAPSASNLKPREKLLQQDLITSLDSYGWDDSTFVAERCYEQHNATGSFLSTAFVARDMLRIVDALGEDGMLRFWGGSYGTLLGQTFAAMFPERVDRMLLDSVGELGDYMEGHWLTTLRDTDKAVDGFFETCISAGPTLCPIANFTGPATTSADLVSALNAAFEALLANPIYTTPDLPLHNSVWNPATTTLYRALKATFFGGLYHPSQYPQLSAVLYPILTQDFSVLLTPPPPSNTTPPIPYNLGLPDAFWGIGCSEASTRYKSPSEMHWLVQEQEAVSGMADSFIDKTWPCAQWKMTAAERYEGDGKAKTNFPILFVNGEYDPITPMASAKAASKNFEGSVVLTHGGHGHKFFRHPSICTAKAVRAYFLNGTMPEEGTYCEADLPAFEVLGAGGPGAGREVEEALRKRGFEDEEDTRLLRRMLEFSALDKGGEWGVQKMALPMI